MSTLMVHVLAAYKYKPDGKPAFFVGNVAPDVIEEHQRKNRTHFRDRSDRMEALKELADRINWEDEFELGVLFHLFLDYHWDIGPIQKHREQYTGENWFLDYRKDIGIIAVWHYHNEPWSQMVWNSMREYRLPMEETICEIRRDELVAFIAKHHNRYMDTEPIRSIVFPPEMVEKFTNQVVMEFKKWCEKIGKS